MIETYTLSGVASQLNRAIASGPVACVRPTDRLPVVRWPLAPAHAPALRQGVVQVWCANLAALTGKLPRFYATLSDRERARAARFRSREHLDAFVIRRGLLRMMLGHYLDDAPAAIEICEGRNGKPELGMPWSRGSLHFSLSHSGPFAVYALTLSGPVGVDVECVRPLPELRDLISCFFTEREAKRFAAMPEPDRPGAFFDLWTRKEAFLKATGQGIGEGFAGTEVAFEPDAAARVPSISGAGDTALGWTFHALAPAPGYAAALTYEGPALELNRWRCPHSLLSFAGASRALVC